MTIFLGLCPMKGRFRFSFACDFSCGEPPRYALRFPPIPMRLLTQWIQWLLGGNILRIPNIESELCFPQSKVAKKHLFFPICFCPKFGTNPFFLPQKILWRKKNGGDFISFLCEGPLHKNISMLCRWGLTGGSNDAPGVSAFFFLNFGRETLFHCFT